jgi:hypothetical protein
MHRAREDGLELIAKNFQNSFLSHERTKQDTDGFGFGFGVRL